MNFENLLNQLRPTYFPDFQYLTALMVLRFQALGLLILYFYNLFLRYFRQSFLEIKTVFSCFSISFSLGSIPLMSPVETMVVPLEPEILVERLNLIQLVETLMANIAKGATVGNPIGFVKEDYQLILESYMFIFRTITEFLMGYSFKLYRFLSNFQIFHSIPAYLLFFLCLIAVKVVIYLIVRKSLNFILCLVLVSLLLSLSNTVPQDLIKNTIESLFRLFITYLWPTVTFTQ